MGGSGAALSDGAEAIYWNPAGLAPLDKREILLSHAELTLSTRHDFVAYAQPSPVGTIGGAVTYLSQAALDGRDALGHPTGGFQASDTAIHLAWARKTDLSDFGVTVKFVQSHIGSSQAQTFALDAGARKILGAVVVGAALRNAGSGLKYDTQRDDLPLRLALGAAYKFAGGHAVTGEVVDGPRGSGLDVGFGGEYQAVKNVWLRAGYTTQSAITGGSGVDAARGLTLGVGYRDGRWNLDYAALPMGELGTAHRISLGARF